MNAKPVILVFIDWFSPGYKAGGPISSCLNFVHLMKDTYSVYVFTSDTDHGDTIPYKDILTNKWIPSTGNDFMIYYAQKKLLGFKQISKVVKEVNPHFVYLNNMFSPYYVLYPAFMKWKGLLKATTIITPRGTLYNSALAVKPLKKKIFINVFRWLGMHKSLIFQATSKREQLAIDRFFPGSKVQVVDDLPSMLQQPYQPVVKEPGTLKCIFISRVVEIKNLLFLLNLLNSVKSNVQLIIVGPIEDPAYWQLCCEQIKNLPAHIQVLYMGSKPAAELPALIQQQHLYILPTLGENFGHTIFEALMVGRPVLISDQTPWLDLDEKNAGWVVPLANSTYYSSIIEQVAGWSQEEFNEKSAAAWQYAKNYLATAGFKEQYQTLFS